MRFPLVVPASFVLLLGLSSLVAADMGVITPAATPEICFTRQAGVYVLQETGVHVVAGQNRFSFDFGRWGIDPASVRLRVLTPASVHLTEERFPANEPDRAVWVLSATEPADCRLRLSYALKGLDAAVNYVLNLTPPRQRLAVTAQVALKNSGKLPFTQARVVLPSGQKLTASLALGETVQQRLFAYQNVAYQAHFLYDNSRFKDSVRAILTLPRDEDSDFAHTALPAGTVKVFAVTAGGSPNFVGQTSIPYVPAREKVDLDLGAAPDISVVRTRLRGDQVNVRTDIYNKLAVYDLEEEYELDIENHRATPATLLVQEHIPGDWQMIRASHPYDKLDAGTVQFTIKLKPGEKTKLDYVDRRLNVEP